jgi:hypothetical protein
VGNEVRGIVAEFVHQDMWGAMDSDFAFKVIQISSKFPFVMHITK